MPSLGNCVPGHGVVTVPTGHCKPDGGGGWGWGAGGPRYQQPAQRQGAAGIHECVEMGGTPRLSGGYLKAAPPRPLARGRWGGSCTVAGTAGTAGLQRLLPRPRRIPALLS